MERVVKVSGKEIEDAIYELCQTAYNAPDGLKVGLHIWENGSVSVSEPMTKSSYLRNTIFDFWLDCGGCDENEEDFEMSGWIDYSTDVIFMEIDAQNGDDIGVKIEVVW